MSRSAIEKNADAGGFDPRLLLHLVEHASTVLYATNVDPISVIFVNKAYEQVWGRSCEEALANPNAWKDSIHPDDRAEVNKQLARTWELHKVYDIEYRIVRPDGMVRWIHDRSILVSSDFPYIVGIADDITDAKLSHSILAAQREILELICTGARVDATLHRLTELIESLSPDSKASILLLDHTAQRVCHASAPSLPWPYIRAIDGAKIGPKAGSCGTAMYLGERVVVTDTYTDPLWADFRDLAHQFGLVACWSQPIFASDGRVLGSFALYPNHNQTPDEYQLLLLETAANLTTIAIERDHAETSLREVNKNLERRVRDRTRRLQSANRRLEIEAEERRQALAALSLSESRFRSIVSSVPGVVYRCLMDSDWTMQFLSEGAKVLSGYRATEFLPPAKRTWASIIHPDDRDQVERDVEDAISVREPFTLEYRILHRDGRIRWVYEQGRAVMEQDQILFLDGVILDATPQKEMQEAIQESEARFRILADETPMLVWMTDSEGQCEFCNRGWIEFTGLTLKSHKGKGWLDCFSKEDQARLISAINLDLSDRTPFQIECLMRRRDGEQRLMLVRGTPRSSSSDDALGRGMIGTALDITEYRAIQEASRNQEAELAHALRHATVGEMASVIAHELNQPLTAISNFANGAARRAQKGELTDETIIKVFDEISSLAQRGGEIIHRVRQLVQTRTPKRGETSFAEILDRAWRMIEPQAVRAQIQFESFIEPTDDPILVDAVQYEQVLTNLLRNAVEELSELPLDRRKLSVKLVRDDFGGLAINVTDTGRGLQMGIENTFEPFQSTKPDGMGLGLAISRTIVEANGGRLSYHPNEPHGSCFQIELTSRGNA